MTYTWNGGVKDSRIYTAAYSYTTFGYYGKPRVRVRVRVRVRIYNIKVRNESPRIIGKVSDIE